MKYWVYMNGEVPGCYTPQELAGLTGFSGTTLVCPAEGEIVEKNWRRSGEFSDILRFVQERDASRPPAVPGPDALLTGDVNALLDSTSARLFGHVSGLMKELETRREERGVLQSVQRQLVELQEQLQRLREKNIELEGRMPRLRELEESSRRDQDRIQMLETAVRGREEGLSELRVQLEKAKTDADAARRRLGDTGNDLAIRNRLVDKLSRDLTEKELSLAKALGLIRRLEEDLHRLTPSEAAIPAAEAAPPAAVEAQPGPAAEPAEDAPAEELHHEAPAAQNAIIGAFKKLIHKDLHS
jgi:uncharacterized coiled-coil protein SlyX